MSCRAGCSCCDCCCDCSRCCPCCWCCCRGSCESAWLATAASAADVDANGVALAADAAAPAAASAVAAATAAAASAPDALLGESGLLPLGDCWVLQLLLLLGATTDGLLLMLARDAREPADVSTELLRLRPEAWPFSPAREARGGLGGLALSAPAPCSAASTTAGGAAAGSAYASATKMRTPSRSSMCS